MCLWRSVVAGGVELEETDNVENEKKEEAVTEIVKFLPPVYSRQLKFLGIVIWSDTRQLDEDLFYDRVTSRLNAELAKEVIKLRAATKR